MPDHNYFANLIWQIADLLRGPYRPPQYERVMLPMTVLRRFDCVLAPTKAKVLAEHERSKRQAQGRGAGRQAQQGAAAQRFHNHSPLDFEKLKGDPDHIAQHLVSYIKGFSANVRRIFEYFEFENEIEKMREANILFLVVSKFCDVDLHPDQVPNEQMGLIFENLIRRFNELANETAGDHFTPREVIRLMVSILFIQRRQAACHARHGAQAARPGLRHGRHAGRSAELPARAPRADAKLYVYGQDYNKRAFATAASDMLMKAGRPQRRRRKHPLRRQLHRRPIRGRDLRLLPHQPALRRGLEEAAEGDPARAREAGLRRPLRRRVAARQRWLAALPAAHDRRSSSRCSPAEQKHGSRLAIVFSGSPLFTGGAGSGESDIRKWIIENDWLEAIIALPEQMFYNTGIGTYIWIVTNRKEKRRKRQDPAPRRARHLDRRAAARRPSAASGDKRRHHRDSRRSRTSCASTGDSRMASARRSSTTKTSATLALPSSGLCGCLPDDRRGQGAVSRRLARSAGRCAGYRRSAGPAATSRLERRMGPHRRLAAPAPLERWKKAEEKLFRECFHAEGPRGRAGRERGSTAGYEPDPDLRDFENVPLKDDIDAYFEREVLPHVPDAWMDREQGQGRL